MIKIDTQMLYTHKYVARFQGQGCNHPCNSHLEAMCAQHRFKHINCTMQCMRRPNSWTKIQNKSLKSFPSCYSQSPLHSFALRLLFLQTHSASYSFYSSVTVHCKRERRKTWKKTISPYLWCKKSIQKPKVWELSRLCPEISTKFLFMNLASVPTCISVFFMFFIYFVLICDSARVGAECLVYLASFIFWVHRTYFGH